MSLELRQISPDVATRFVDGFADSVPGQKTAMAALRLFFDMLLARHGVDNHHLAVPFHELLAERKKGLSE